MPLMLLLLAALLLAAAAAAVVVRGDADESVAATAAAAAARGGGDCAAGGDGCAVAARRVFVMQNGGNVTGAERRLDVDVSDGRTVQDVIEQAAMEFALVPPGCRGAECHRHMRLMDASGVQVLTWRDVFSPFGPPPTADSLPPTLYVLRAGEQWTWPPMYVGHKMPLIYTGQEVLPRQLELETISVEPRIFRVANFLSDEEAEAIIGIARDQLFRSAVSEPDGSRQSDVRTSQQAWLYATQHKIVDRIDHRVAELTRIPIEHQLDEAMQVVHYDVSQKYEAHQDSFDPATYPNHPAYQQGCQRLATFFYYLNDVDGGGETVFPRANVPGAYGRDENMMDWSDCTRGLAVKPSKGDAILWYNLDVASQVEGKTQDLRALHGGCRVVSGEKWGANKWLHNKPLDRRPLQPRDAPTCDEAQLARCRHACAAMRLASCVCTPPADGTPFGTFSPLCERVLPQKGMADQA